LIYKVEVDFKWRTWHTFAGCCHTSKANQYNTSCNENMAFGSHVAFDISKYIEMKHTFWLWWYMYIVLSEQWT